MKTRVSKILELCKKAQELAGEDDPEITYDEVMKALFPQSMETGQLLSSSQILL